MKQRFAGKVVWITGGGSGIGAATAHEFARQGATLVLSGRRLERLELVCDSLRSSGGQALALPCDVTDESQIEGVVDALVDRFGKLDVALANAGYAVTGSVAQLNAAEWRRQLDVNVVGSAMTVRYALPHLEKSHGRVGLIGSVAALICAPKLAAYNASKHALRALGLTLSAELHGSGVTCTTVHPGYVASEIAKVDNGGVFHADKADRRSKRLMWPADKAARVVVDAIYRRRRELVFTGHGKVGAFIGQHLPAVAHLMMR